MCYILSPNSDEFIIISANSFVNCINIKIEIATLSFNLLYDAKSTHMIRTSWIFHIQAHQISTTMCCRFDDFVSTKWRVWCPIKLRHKSRKAVKQLSCTRINGYLCFWQHSIRSEPWAMTRIVWMGIDLICNTRKNRKNKLLFNDSNAIVVQSKRVFSSFVRCWFDRSSEKCKVWL